jgi:hypothetical protein
VECAGCNKLQGQVSWAKYLNKTVCPIYTCVKQKGFSSCRDCDLPPCHIWLIETKNPDVSEQAFAADITNRLKNLGKNKPQS